MKGPTRDLELSIGGIIAGVDEVGTGPLCGPVCAVAVIIPAEGDFSGWIDQVNDSKQLSHQVRERLAAEIRKTCFVGVGLASVEEISRFNVLASSHMAMCRAIESLPFAPTHVLVDGSRVPRGIKAPVTTVIKGDTKCVSIAAASVVAKVHRDALMAKIHEEFPMYGFDRNAGYGTPVHLEALKKHGPCPHHRLNFRGVRQEPAPPAIADLFS